MEEQTEEGGLTEDRLVHLNIMGEEEERRRAEAFMFISVQTSVLSGGESSPSSALQLFIYNG